MHPVYLSLVAAAILSDSVLSFETNLSFSKRLVDG